MKKLDSFIAGLYKYDEADQQRQAAFYFVRNIPYSTVNSHTIRDAIESKHADCHAKCELLKYLFKAIGYETQSIIMLYRLRNFPLEVQYIPNQLDYHYVPQILLNNVWVSVDATYDPPLASLGFIVNEWDGSTSTAFAEKSLGQKAEYEINSDFDKKRAEFETSLKGAYLLHADQIISYQIKFNEWLMSARKT